MHNLNWLKCTYLLELCLIKIDQVKTVSLNYPLFMLPVLFVLSILSLLLVLLINALLL
jgi:hypothetical protein